MSLDRRCCIPEVMDDPELDRQRHVAALRGLARINWWSRSASIVWREIHGLARESNKDELRILDIASGAGDVPLRLARLAHRSGIVLHIDACDISPQAVNFGQEKAARAGASVRFFQLDALHDELPAGYDVVMSSLFLHHLTDDSARLLLDKMLRAASKAVLVNDLVRCRTGLLLAYVASRLLTTSDVVHTDAVRSVRAAFTLDEIRAMTKRSDCGVVRLERRWPCRFLLVCER